MEQVYRRSVEVAERLVRLGVRVEVTMNRRGTASDGSLGSEVIVNTSLGTTLTALESLADRLESIEPGEATFPTEGALDA